MSFTIADLLTVFALAKYDFISYEWYNLNNGFLSHGIQDYFGTNFDNFSEGNSQSAIFERNYRNFCRKHLKLREINSLFRLILGRLRSVKPESFDVVKTIISNLTDYNSRELSRS